MTEFSRELVKSARMHGMQIVVDETAAHLGPPSMHGVELDVKVDGELIGYITPYSEHEYGAIWWGDFGRTLPRVFTVVEDAIRDIVQSIRD